MGVHRIEEQANLDLFPEGLIEDHDGLEQLIIDLQDANGGDN